MATKERAGKPPETRSQYIEPHASVSPTIGPAQPMGELEQALTEIDLIGFTGSCCFRRVSSFLPSFSSVLLMVAAVMVMVAKMTTAACADCAYWGPAGCCVQCLKGCSRCRSVTSCSQYTSGLPKNMARRLAAPKTARHCMCVESFARAKWQ